jgi:broad specificity phosphatase PhoE
VPGGVVDPGLRPWDLGCWRGQPLAALDPTELARWRADPTFAGHGGETLVALTNRVAVLLRGWQRLGRTDQVVAVTHGAVIKAAVALALHAPLAAIWDLDVHPASVTELHPRADGWRVAHVNRLITARQ